MTICTGQTSTLQSSAADIGIIVALAEEFRILLAKVGQNYDHGVRTEDNLVFYSFLWPPPTEGRTSYRCVATFIGEMGPTTAAVSTERMIRVYQPITVVNIGVAGAMSNDVRLLDVVIGDVIDEYISSAKATADAADQAFPFKLSGRPYCTRRDYLLHSEHLEFTRPAEFCRWQSAAEERLLSACSQHPRLQSLLDDASLPRRPSLHKGHIASGPVVLGAASYKNSLLARRDRKYVAVEMEAAGVMAATADGPTATLVIRGVSDPADERKLADDKAGAEGAIRKLAMENAVEFLFLLLDLKLLVFLDTAHEGGQQAPASTGAPQGARPALPIPADEVHFHYLPDAIQLHGWRIAVNKPESPLPVICPLADPDVGVALSVTAPLSGHLDYDTSDSQAAYNAIDFVFAEIGPFTFYARLLIIRGTERKTAWLAIIPCDDEPPAPLLVSKVEWAYYVRPSPGPGRWSIISVDLRRAVEQTFDKEGWKLERLHGFRLRGTVFVGRIGLFRELNQRA